MSTPQTPATPTPGNTPNTGLSVTSAIDTSVHLLQGVLSVIPQTAIAGEVAGLIGTALDKLLTVQNTPTTFGQLEGLRLQKRW